VIITGTGREIGSRRVPVGRRGFYRKAFDEAELRVAIEKGWTGVPEAPGCAEGGEQALKLAKLTNREREVLELVGKACTERNSGVSQHQRAHGRGAQSRLMEKLEARNVPNCALALAAKRDSARFGRRGRMIPKGPGDTHQVSGKQLT